MPRALKKRQRAHKQEEKEDDVDDSDDRKEEKITGETTHKSHECRERDEIESACIECKRQTHEGRDRPRHDEDDTIDHECIDHDIPEEAYPLDDRILVLSETSAHDATIRERSLFETVLDEEDVLGDEFAAYIQTAAFVLVEFYVAHDERLDRIAEFSSVDFTFAVGLVVDGRLAIHTSFTRTEDFYGTIDGTREYLIEGYIDLLVLESYFLA